MLQLMPRRAFTVATVAAVALALLAACSTESTTTDGDASADVAGDSLAAKCLRAADGQPCNDGSACTQGETCQAGVCLGVATSCDDGLPCTTDGCDPGNGCTHAVSQGCLIDGACLAADATPTGDACKVCTPAKATDAWSPKPVSTPCNDGDSCTVEDSCDATGTCKGSTSPCDDSNPCTVDACQPVQGCVSTAQDGGCDDGNPSTVNDLCKAGNCMAGKDKLTCDDGDPCTSDTCAKGEGCAAVADPTACNDSDPCTTDTCDKTQGCGHVALAQGAACTTGDKCQVGQTCDPEGKCSGGNEKDCDDGNVCTDDSCQPASGCAHWLNHAACNDDVSCTTPDLCTGGVCIGIKTAWCPTCEKIFDTMAGKLTVFQVGSSGKPSEGLDIDGDPATCSPKANCEGGINNSASMLSGLINKPLIAAIADGSMSFVAEFDGWKGEGIPFTLNLYHGVMTQESKSAGCDAQTQVCKWVVTQDAMDASCLPKFSFKNAKVVGGQLVAGGADTLFAMDAALLGAQSGTLYVKGARIEGTVEFTPDGKQILKIAGVLGGAVPQQALFDVINALDDTLFAQYGMSKETVLALVQLAVELDIDMDGNGIGDAASIGLRFSAIGAKIVGMASGN